jgi:hypothetical protein
MKFDDIIYKFHLKIKFKLHNLLIDICNMRITFSKKIIGRGSPQIVTDLFSNYQFS